MSTKVIALSARRIADRIWRFDYKQLLRIGWVTDGSFAVYHPKLSEEVMKHTDMSDVPVKSEKELHELIKLAIRECDRAPRSLSFPLNPLTKVIAKLYPRAVVRTSPVRMLSGSVVSTYYWEENNQCVGTYFSMEEP